MAAMKPIRLLYQARGNQTGLTDVKAQIYLNGVAKATGVGAIVLTEVNSSNVPGLYELLIPAGTLTTWGVNQTTSFYVEGLIDSVVKPAPAAFRTIAEVASTDDLDVAVAALSLKVGTPAGASIAADIAAIKSDTAAIKVDLESGPNSLATILTAVQAIQNNAGFSIPVPAELVKPATGTNLYRIPLTIYDEKNALVDPDTNAIVVTLVNSAGTDRSTLLTGNSGGSAPAVRDSLGQYHIDITISPSTVEEELIFKFAYAIGGAATARMSTTMVEANLTASGFALQSTLLSVQSDVAAVKTDVESVTSGLGAIKTAVDNTKTAVDNANLTLADIEGAGFSTSTDSLKAISAYLLANIYIGGYAV